MAKKLMEKIKGLMTAGFFDIFGATLLNSVVSFIYGIFIIRLLTKTEYGIFAYVQNILNFGVMFCSLGGNVGLLQFCAEPIEESRKYGYCKLAWRMGLVGSTLIPLGMLLYARVDRSEVSHLLLYTAELVFLPLFYFMKEWTTANLRWQFKNREYGIVMNVHSLLNALFAVCGAYIWGIQGVIGGIYLAYIGSSMCGMYFLRGTVLRRGVPVTRPPRKDKRKFLDYSLTMCVVNALISVLFTIDLFVIGNIMKNEEQIAMYKTACTIPFALNMIPNAIMVFAYPHIAMHREEQTWMRKHIRLLYLANGGLNLCIGIGLIVVAPILLPILFSKTYADTVPVFRILVLSYLVSSCLRTPAANLLAVLRMSKTALVVSAATVVLCVTMGVTLVGRYGIVGAAWGSVCTFGTVGLVSTAIILYVVYWKKDKTKERVLS